MVLITSVEVAMAAEKESENVWELADENLEVELVSYSEGTLVSWASVLCVLDLCVFVSFLCSAPRAGVERRTARPTNKVDFILSSLKTTGINN
jgi:hypothetical protein